MANPQGIDYCKEFGHWNDDEKLRLTTWISKNPNRRAYQSGGTIAELQEMFPNRTPWSIYSRWRKMRHNMGLSCARATRKNKETAPVAQKNTSGFENIKKHIESNLSFWNNMKQLVESKQQNNDGITKLEAEVQELKALLRKLTAVREACEKFQL